MSREYAASTDPLQGISWRRRVVRPLGWTIMLIREIFATRYEQMVTGIEVRVSPACR
jgi:hypothetical protein